MAGRANRRVLLGCALLCAAAFCHAGSRSAVAAEGPAQSAATAPSLPVASGARLAGDARQTRFILDLDQTISFRAFTLADLPAKDGLEWVQATPRAETTIRTLRVGFRDHALAELEMVDSFGQDSLIVFDGFQPNAKLPAADFRFVPPKGADVIDQ